MSKAKRYNKGKLRYDLIPHEALKLLAEVYTKGAHKYTVYEDDEGNEIRGSDLPLEECLGYKIKEAGDNNWRLGQNWSGSMASVERHIAAWKAGEDMDDDLGTYHLANAAWGLFSILTYYKIYPHGDDRPLPRTPRIGLDVDDVLADFTGEWSRKYDIPRPTSWKFDRNLYAAISEMSTNNELGNFFLSLPVLTPSDSLDFEPTCYITHRHPDSEGVTEEWLDKYGFPAAPVIRVDGSKVQAAKDMELDIFVDDKYENFRELTDNGIFCYLYDRPHNRRYNIGHKRIYNLQLCN